MIHLYCLAVQAGFYSDVVECSTLDRRVPGSILGRGMEIFLRVHDNGAPTWFYNGKIHPTTYLNTSVWSVPVWSYIYHHDGSIIFIIIIIRVLSQLLFVFSCSARVQINIKMAILL